MKLPYLPASVPAARAPSWDLSRCVRRGCPVCGADEPESVCTRPDGLEAARCLRCRMIYLPVVPDDAALRDFYAQYSEWKGCMGAASAPGRLRLALDAMRDLNVSILEETGGLSGRRLLEIGPSYGHFLERARWCGAQVEGVESDHAAQAHLAARGIDAHPEIQLERRYDVVCAFQVFEHLSAPHAMAETIARVLAPDGRLLVGVPNGGEAAQVGGSWVGFRVDLEHVNYFSAETMARLLAEHGLFVEQFWCTSQPVIGRPRFPESTGLGARMRRVGRSLAARLFSAHRQAQAGSFALTLLARRLGGE